MNEIKKSHGQGYADKYQIIHEYAPCEYKMAELVEQLDAEEQYEKLLQDQGLKVLRNNRMLAENPKHNKLLSRLVSFNQYWIQYQNEKKEREK